ncbi:DNA glycosylase [Auriscalpium vulgare]|uniref:DNA glycosylase n=1 Tax=Auriscalpium vulgare TaxID=40419 RepID=A0ACB8R979_9AGAM|nr:DNA glycosylase [Auriscalpium vulgare]
MPKRKPAFSDESEYSAHFSEPSSSNKKKAPVKKKTKRVPVVRERDTEGELPNTFANSHPASQHTISASVAHIRRDALLAWYAGVHAHRGMPWRKPYDPSFNADDRAQRAYEVWVSEIMLQQTQVATVIPYYNRWMTAFPTIKHLANSNIDTVNGLWKGLGYYSRAARLLSGAQKVVQDLNGRLPDNAKEMESLIPGIGRYTAGAICSIAYNEQVPVLDGNVNRLLSRVLALHSSPKLKATLDILWSAAQAIVKDASAAGDVNQALIELGSTVCKPKDPNCKSCPLAPSCSAHQLAGSVSDSQWSIRPELSPNVPDIEELCTLCEPIPRAAGEAKPPVTSYPMKVERKKQREELDIVNVVEWRAQGERWFLLVRRPEGGLLAGLYEFPTSPDIATSISSAEEKAMPFNLLGRILTSAPVDGRPNAQAAKPDTNAPADHSTGPKIVKIQRAGDVLHVFSHIRKTYRVQWVVLEGGTGVPELVPVDSIVPVQANGKIKINAPAVKKTGKGKKANDSVQNGIATPVTAQWVRLDDVERANIGTGVMKVWTLARTLWEGVLLFSTQ